MVVFFFFSSRRRHTRWTGDWSSDVCSSDLAGKVRYVGASNYSAWRLARALWASDVGEWARYESLQPNYSLVKRSEFERELRPLCQEMGLGVIPYSPLAAGFLTGKYRRGEQA